MLFRYITKREVNRKFSVMKNKIFLVFLFLVIGFLIYRFFYIDENLPTAKNYLQITIDEDRQQKSSYTVRINHRITEDSLKIIADDIIKIYKPICPTNAFITVLLPIQEDGNGSWAEILYQPNYNFKILGTTLNEYKNLLKVANGLKANKDILGVWLEDDFKILYVLKKKNKHVILLIYDENSSFSQGCSITKVNQKGKIWFKCDDNEFGDKYTINPLTKNLMIFDDRGYVGSLEKM